jgi:hypothetical protein
MWRWLAPLVAVLVVSANLVHPVEACDEHSVPVAAGNPDAVPNELVVTFKTGVPSDRAMEISSSLGVDVVKTMLGGRVQHVRAPAGASVEQLREQYLAYPEVTRAEPNYRIRAR